MNTIFQSIVKFFRSLFGYTENTQNPVIQTNVPPKKIEESSIAFPEKKDTPIILQPEPQSDFLQSQTEIATEVPPITDDKTEVPKEEELHISIEVPANDVPKEEKVLDNQSLADAAPALNLQIERYSFGEKDTLGKFYINGKFYSYTLEDIHPSKGKSRFEFSENAENKLYFNCIPAGLYELALRTTGGGMHTTYTLKYPHIHKGMLSLLHVPQMPYIFFQIGASEADTKGCIIVGEKIVDEANVTQARGMQGSEDAYCLIYPLVADYLVKGGKVYLTVTDAVLK